MPRRSGVVKPDGSLAAPAARGFDLLHNYFCDLIRPVAHNGEPNGSCMLLGQMGMIVTGLSFVPLFLLLPRLFSDHEIGRTCIPFGLAAAAMFPAVPFTPSSVAASWHTAAIALAGLPGFLALATGTAGILAVRQHHPRLAVLTTCMFAAALVTGGLYAATFSVTWFDASALPTAQKLAWALLVAWMLASTRLAAAAPPSAPRRPAR